MNLNEKNAAVEKALGALQDAIVQVIGHEAEDHRIDLACRYLAEVSKLHARWSNREEPK